jgi:hypothetical protein
VKDHLGRPGAASMARMICTVAGSAPRGMRTPELSRLDHQIAVFRLPESARRCHVASNHMCHTDAGNLFLGKPSQPPNQGAWCKTMIGCVLLRCQAARAPTTARFCHSVCFAMAGNLHRRPNKRRTGFVQRIRPPCSLAGASIGSSVGTSPP